MPRLLRPLRPLLALRCRHLALSAASAAAGVAAAATAAAPAHTATAAPDPDAAAAARRRLPVADAMAGASAKTAENLAQQVITVIYKGVDPSQGPELSAAEEDAVDDSGGSHIYGEITPKGVVKLFKWLRRRGADGTALHRLPHGWGFADLGSGVGRLCVQVAIMSPRWGCGRSVGVELSHTRHLAALRAAKQAKAFGALPPDCSLEFREADILHTPLDGLTVVYVASLLFEDEMLAQLAARLEAAPDVQWVATLRRLPRPPLQTLRLDGIVMLSMSWDEAATTEVFMYVRDRDGVLPDFESGGGMSAEEAETRAFFRR